VREFARRFRGTRGRGRIVALTSDHVAGNLPYGASKGALDRIVLAAATEFGHAGCGITANVVNPGPTDTGWMTNEQLAEFARQPRDLPLLDRGRLDQRPARAQRRRPAQSYIFQSWYQVESAPMPSRCTFTSIT
jgi:NAD(P)-dependent dehydrogenase (short-subunit alcohol dehydrogenase family)